ncbi:hypothetical protein GCG21_10425 [Pseudactinotalea sp. HY160]|nr:hypothetical protein [Pseudactinotalea sp. HY160]
MGRSPPPRGGGDLPISGPMPGAPPSRPATTRSSRWESGKEPFARRLLKTTAADWGPNAEAAIRGQVTPVSRIGIEEFLDSSIDWEQFLLRHPGGAREECAQTSPRAS